MEHTLKPYDHEIAELEAKLVRMGGAVECMLRDSLEALASVDTARAQRIIGDDRLVNGLEVEIDEAAIQLLARYQPVAIDLRFITMALKVAAELERAGDQAVNVCEQCMKLAELGYRGDLFTVPQIGAAAADMLHDAVGALAHRDAELAQRVSDRDAEVDRLHAGIFRDLHHWMAETPNAAAVATRLMFVSKYLERAADHATHVAEALVYFLKGRDLRQIKPHTPEP